MNKFVKKIKSFTWTKKHIGIVSISTIALIAAKLYCRGDSCKVDRNIQSLTIIVTGGNSGIGKQTVEQLASRRCKIIFGARDVQKSQKVVKEILSKHKNAKIEFIPLDLGSKVSINKFVSEVNDKCDKIDILINNAAVFGYPVRTLTKDGYQMHMGVNHIGHFYLTSGLWGKIRSAEKPRIISVSSNAHGGYGFFLQNLKLDFEDLDFLKGYSPTLAYSRSKIANILFVKELQNRMDYAQIEGAAVSVHPGAVRTDIVRSFGLGIQVLSFLAEPFKFIFMKNPWEGAQTTLYTVLEDYEKLTKGGHYANCQVAKTTPFTCELENAKMLWKLTEAKLGHTFSIV